MLKSAHIKNFRACRDVKLAELGSMLALVGRNGAGKTTLLQAIAWAASAALASDAFSKIGNIEPDDALADPFAELVIVTDAREYQYRISRTILEHDLPGRPKYAVDEESLHTRLPDESEWQRLFSRADDVVTIPERRATLAIHPSTAAMPALLSLLPRSDPLQAHLRAVTDALRRVRYYPGHNVFDPVESLPEEPNGLVSEDDYQQWIAAEDRGTRPASVLMRLIAAHHRRPEVFAELKALMGPDALDLLRDICVDTFEPTTGPRGRQPRYFAVSFTSTSGYSRLTLDQLSGGTRHALYLLLGLLYDESSTMLIEQPEDGIHPALLAKLIDILRVNADPTQIVLASHSPTVLSSLRPTDIRLVHMEDSAIQVRSLTDAEVARAQDYIRREGSLAEFLELIQED